MGKWYACDGIKERELPKPRTRQEDATQPRKINSEQLAQAASFMESVKVSVPAEWDIVPFEDLLDSAMRNKKASSTWIPLAHPPEAFLEMWEKERGVSYDDIEFP